MGRREGLFSWKKPARPSPLVRLENWLSLPEELTVRIIHARIQQKGFRVRQLRIVTTLLDAQLYPTEEILAGYAKRWRMEMCLDDLKTTLGMEQLSCRTPAMVHRELLVFLTAHNLLRWIMAQAAQNDPVVRPYRSFLNLAEGKVFCIMEAPSKDALAAWFKKMQMPTDSVTPVEYEGECGAIQRV